MIEKLTDIHFHGVPGVDDGARNIEESLHMIKLSYDQGVRAIVITPHSDPYFSKAYYQDSIKPVLCEAEKLYPDLKIGLGCEVLCEYEEMDSIIEGLDSGCMPSLNNTEYVLAELSPFLMDMDDIEYCMRKLLDNGWIPVIAHLERSYYRLKTADNVRFLKDMGCLIQVNYYDLGEEKDEDIREFARMLLEQKLIDFMGSDAHRISHRPPAVSSGAAYIQQNCDVEYAGKILFGNAEMLFSEGRDNNG